MLVTRLQNLIVSPLSDTALSAMTFEIRTRFFQVPVS